MSRATLRWVFALLCVVWASGCVANYIPRPGPRLSMVMNSGRIDYVRDGHLFRGGAFGGELESAVAGNPEAERHARAYRDGTLTGFGLTLGGAGAFLLSVTVPLAFLSPSSSGSSVPEVVGVLSGGTLLALALEIAGVIVQLNAAPHLYDAINAYNDGIPLCPVPAPAMMLPPVQLLSPPVGSSRAPVGPATARRAPSLASQLRY